MDLIRLLLLQAEGVENVKSRLSEYSPELIEGHFSLLIEQKFLTRIAYLDVSGSTPPTEVWKINWSGHDLLDSMRDPKIWKIAKEKILGPGVSFTFGLLTESLKSLAKNELRNAGIPFD